MTHSEESHSGLTALVNEPVRHFAKLPAMGDPGELQPLFLLSDEPIGLSGDDGLGMNQTARVIAEAALGAATPFTVGIFGPWGHGKTSLLNAARTLLEPVGPDGTITRPHPHVVTVQFNAWRYEREEHPIVPLVASIAHAVKQRFEEDQSFERAIGEKGKAVALKVVDGAMALIGATKLDSKARIGNPLVGQVEAGASIDVATAMKGYADKQDERKRADQPRIQTQIEQSLYLSAFDDLARLHAWAKTNGRNQTGQAPVIVVFIDDLDRCRPEAAVQILEGIKLVLAQPGFVFVLALYREVIERYLEREAEVRYGVDRKDIGAGYLDKIVQLPLWLPSHEGAFENYIREVIDKKLKPGLMPHRAKPNDPETEGVKALVHAIYICTPLLARLSDHSPRRLVRKINELLIDDRLLPLNAHEAVKCKPEERRSILFPLCLIQRALQELPKYPQMAALMANNDLCEALAFYRRDLENRADADDNVGPLLFWEALKRKAQESSTREGTTEAHSDKAKSEAVDPAFDSIDAVQATRWLRATACLTQEPQRAVLLNTTAGRFWLANHAGRGLVAKVIVLQTAQPIAMVADPMRGVTTARGNTTETSVRSDQQTPVSEELRQEVEIIERAIRAVLALRGLAVLGPAEYGSVTRLRLDSEPITDAGVKWLSDPARGFKGLTMLSLYDTQVTDVGLKELARADTGLKTLAKLYLDGTSVTDAGLKELARADTGLKALTSLNLSSTSVTDAGLKELARADTGLKALTKLFLDKTQVTDVGLKELARADTGLKALTILYLVKTQVTDVGLKELARADTGLKALTSLDLSSTSVTDAGLKELARADSGLKALTILYLVKTQVTYVGLKELARADTGLKTLAKLYLDGTSVTDAGLKELARADTGLKALTSLDLSSTSVTDAGLKELARADTGLKALTKLFLDKTQVTDVGLKELARADTGLKALTILYLVKTQVTDVGLKELARADTGLKTLKVLYLKDTQVTQAGIAALQAARPGLEAYK